MYKPLTTIAFLSLCALPLNADYPFYKVISGPFRSCAIKSANYLHHRGPTKYSFYLPKPCFDRSKLIPITTIEKAILEESTPILKTQSKTLEEAHEKNLQKLETPPDDLIISAPPLPLIKIITAPEATEETKEEPTEEKATSAHEELIDLIEVEAEQSNGKLVTLPFSLPFKEDPSPIPLPSKSLYERR